MAISTEKRISDMKKKLDILEKKRQIEKLRAEIEAVSLRKRK